MRKTKRELEKEGEIPSCSSSWCCYYKYSREKLLLQNFSVLEKCIYLLFSYSLSLQVAVSQSLGHMLTFFTTATTLPKHSDE